jgi:hypothetical protein
MRSSDIETVLIEARRQFWHVLVIALVTAVVLLLDGVGGPLVAGLGLTSLAFSVRLFNIAIKVQNGRRGGAHNGCRSVGNGRVDRTGSCCRQAPATQQNSSTDQWSCQCSQLCSPTRQHGDDHPDDKGGQGVPDRPMCCNSDIMNDFGSDRDARSSEGISGPQSGTCDDHGVRQDQQDRTPAGRADCER